MRPMSPIIMVASLCGTQGIYARDLSRSDI